MSKKKLKVIVAGSRSIQNYVTVYEAIMDSGFWPDQIAEIVSGTAKGVDVLGELFANDHFIPVKKFPAHWKEHGRSAGMIRNQQMAQYADALIAVWDGKSSGTANMIKEARNNGLRVFLWKVEPVKA